jgi:hypothetical protein
MNKSEQIRDYAAANPTAKASDIGTALGFKTNYVYAVLWADKQRGGVKVTTRSKAPTRPAPKKWKMLHISTSNTPIVSSHGTPIQIEMIEPKSDPVNHPAHYKVGGMETIDFIEAKRLNYNMGNAVKYITRADHKGSRKQDLEKAIWYLKRELDHSV